MESPIWIFIVFAVVAVAAVIMGAIQAKRRREAFAKLARRLGLRYEAGHDPSLARRFGFLDKLASGSDRYAENVVSGTWNGEEVFVFDYHYETHSTDSKGRRQTHHHYLSCFLLLLPGHFPELTISSEGLFSKIAQTFGYEDISYHWGDRPDSGIVCGSPIQCVGATASIHSKCME